MRFLSLFICQVDTIRAVVEQHQQIIIADFPHDIIKRPSVTLARKIYQCAPDGMPAKRNGVITAFYLGYLPPVLVVPVYTEMFDKIGNGGA